LDLSKLSATEDDEMFGSNDENYLRARTTDFIKSREAVNKELLEAKVMQRRNSIEAMRQRYTTMQKVARDNNALYIARKCRHCVGSIDNTILAAQYSKMEAINSGRTSNKSQLPVRGRPLDIETLRRRYNLDN
jgi:hypothetical protein